MKNRKLMAATRIWFGTAGWTFGTASQYLVNYFDDNRFWLVGLFSYMVFYVILSAILEGRYGNQ